MDFMDAYRRIYASWLGKCIGVRLGSPIENWTWEQIRKTYAPIHGYTTDYGQYAADDDLNGPLFFVRAMEDHTIEEVTPEDMGSNMLNVVAPLHGFYWWGGPGIATEHTAYANLQNGIKAPASGSAAVNGKTIAEQIGGQIFSDCWGFLSLGNPEEAADLAAKMSSVTHDLDGIEGGRFVAACIALAWHMHDARTIIEESRKYLDPKSTYTALVNEFLAFHEAHPEDAQACLDYIHAHHGYDKYEGVCHILPNTAIMLYGMLYGRNDFNETMRLIAEAGCDTDCNLGNVGAIMGMMLGLEGIDEKWILPFNDILLSSSALGARNIDTISGTALYFTKLAMKLHHLPAEEVSPFALPYATHGFRAETNADHAVHTDARHGALRLIIDRLLAGESFRIWKTTYFRAEDVYDVRYEPQFTGLLEPGDTVEFTISTPDNLPLSFTPYIKDHDGKITAGEKARAGTVCWTVPDDALPLLETGLIVECTEYIERTLFNITDFRIIKHPSATIDFTKTTIEDWGTDIGLVHRYGLSNLVIHEGQAHKAEEGVLLDPHSAINFSGPDTLYRSAQLKVKAGTETDLFFSWTYRGVRRHDGLHIHGSRASLYHRWDDDETETILGSFPAVEDMLTLGYDGNTVSVNGHSFPAEGLKEQRGALLIKNLSETPLCIVECTYRG